MCGDRVALPKTDSVHNLEGILDLQFLVKEQVAVVAQRAFAQLHIVCQLCPFLDLVLNHSFLDHLLSGLLLCALHGTTLEEYSETIVVSERTVAWTILEAPSVVPVTPLLSELHWLLICFQVLFRKELPNFTYHFRG